MQKQILVAMLALGLTGAAASAHARPQPKKVVIQECKAKRPGVPFNHEEHIKKDKIACKTCHHTGKQVVCVSCHAGMAKGKKPGCAEMSQTKNPYHLTCAGCHKKQGKGPTTCKACHK